MQVEMNRSVQKSFHGACRMSKVKPNPPAETGGRHAAGGDPAKRAQILDGAKRVFSQTGFDGASMNDITREAGVSKGTVYVYFPSKEDLFEAMVEREREVLFGDIVTLLEGPEPIDERLARYARRVVTLMCSDEVVRAVQVMIGTSAKMPELGAKFYEGGGQKGWRKLRDFLDGEVAAGRLSISDTGLAAHQFAVLATAGLWRRRLFAHLPVPPDAALVENTVAGAVRVFLAAYGR